MANRTVKDAKVVHGTNPQYLVEKIIRTRIYECRYWKEECFGANEAAVFDRALELRFVGGIYGGNIKPSPFLCLTLKMLQLQPEKDIIINFIGKFGEAYKYVRALGAFYLRLTGTSLENWKYLEPLYNDYRKLRIMDRMGKFSVVHMDEYIDMLLRDERVFDVILPRISKRRVHEEADELEPRISALDEDLEQEEEDEQPEPTKADDNKESHREHKKKKKHKKREERDKPVSPDERQRSYRDRDHDRHDRGDGHRRYDGDRKDRNRERKRSPDRDQYGRRRSPDRDRRRRDKSIS